MMILCAGEALIDMLPGQTTSGQAAFVPRPGGAVLNTARALGRLGAEAGFLCPLSTDLFGRMLVDALAESHVDARLCPRVDRPCTLAFVSLDGGQARYLFYDRGTALAGLTPAEMPAIPDPVQALFLGGISLIGADSGAAFEALAGAAGARVVMLDPNIRPAFIPDPAAHRARLSRLIARSDILKLSDEDLAWLVPDTPPERAIPALLAAGPSLVLLTRGAAGAEGWTAAGHRALPAPRVAVVDTVGAGDTFNAGVLAGLAQAGALTRPALRALSPEALDTALSLGIAAAAVTTTRPGADPPWRHELPLA